MRRHRSRAVAVPVEPWRPVLLASAAVVIGLLVLHDQAAALLPALSAYAGAWFVLGLQHRS